MTQTTPTRDEAVLSAAEIERIIDTYVRAQIKFSTDLTTVTILGKGTAASSIANRLASAPAPASGRVDAVARESMDLDEIKQRILGTLDDYQELGPEEGESWQSWYCAAFDLASEKIAKLLASLSPAATPVSEAGGEPAMTDAQIKQWIEACNHEPARETLRHYLRLRALAKPAGVSLEAVVAAIESQMPATQDMTSTFICEALERTIAAVHSLSQSTSAGRGE